MGLCEHAFAQGLLGLLFSSFVIKNSDMNPFHDISHELISCNNSLRGIQSVVTVIFPGTFCFFASAWFKKFLICNRTGTFNMIYWHWAELTAPTLYPATQLKPLTMCCWLHANSLTGHFVHWRRVWPCRDSSAAAAAAACNMWPQSLPASPLSKFHYLLFNSSPCWWTAAKSPTEWSQCQEISCQLVLFFLSEEIQSMRRQELECYVDRKCGRPLLKVQADPRQMCGFKQSSVAPDSHR